MTREEAIKALIKERKTALHENKQAFDMAIKALEQEPCEDCVSRQAVLEKINDWWGITSTSGEPTLCDCIRELPPVAPTQKWIPVSERLLEEEKIVIASMEYGLYPEARYTKEGWEWAYESGADYWENLENVLAWMPLPEPYKAEMESEE